MINCARMNAMIRVLKNSQALRPIFRQFSFREVSTLAYDSGPAGASQFTDCVADTSNSAIVHAPGWRGPLRSDPHVGPVGSSVASIASIESLCSETQRTRGTQLDATRRQ